jgi:hypothetical protein
MMAILAKEARERWILPPASDWNRGGDSSGP